NSNVTERELLEGALDGDEDAFRHLIEPHRAVLFAHCNRMLGSFEDADDALQDTLLHAWRGLSGFDGRCPIRGWLYRIATNACLDLIERRPKRVLSIEQSPPYGAWQAVTTADAFGMELYPDRLLEEGEAVPDTCYERREAVRLAYAMAVKHLAPRQRAVL